MSDEDRILGLCPHCGEPIVRGTLRPLPTRSDKALEHYYRARARGSKVTLRQVATDFDLNESYLRAAKVEYDRAGKWGSKKKAK
jgi:hypothetical protein